MTLSLDIFDELRLEVINDGQRVNDRERVYFGNDQDVSFKWEENPGELRILDSAGNINAKYLRYGDYNWEWYFLKSAAYTASQAPILTLQQASTGECLLRYKHGDDTGVQNWCIGELGRTSGGVVFRDFVLFLDTIKVALTAHYAADETAGRILICTSFWDTTAPEARLTVRLVADEKGLVVKGHSTQTNDVVQVLKSDDTVLFKITNTGTVLGAYLNAANLPTSNPSVVGQVYSNSGVLTVSAG